MKRRPIAQYGYQFVEQEYIPEHKDEYYLRNEQIAHWEAQWRHLTEEEILQLIQQGNFSANWHDILVEDPIDLSLITHNYFAGLIRIGSLEPFTVSYHDFILPEGIRDSHIISCDIGRHCSIHRCAYLSHYIIGERAILSEIDEMDTTAHAKFGNGIVKEGEEESVRIWLNILNESETRSILPFKTLICADAWMWGIYREDEVLMKRLFDITNGDYDVRRGYYGIVGDYAIIKSCRVIKDVSFGDYAYVKGANKLKNLTIQSSEASPTQIGEGVELVNGIIGFGCHVFYGVKAVRFVMCNNSNLKYGARLLNSVLGDNSTISCCEVLNTLVFPFHEQHHNNSFLIASLIMGQSNMAAGANIGSNHNTRGSDGEMQAGRGFWPALSSSLKFNSKFASYTLITKGDYPHELHIPIPFSMITYNEQSDILTIMPAYWWMYNRYALERNGNKFKNRDKRVVAVQHIETDYYAPDTQHEILHAMDLLALWVGRSAVSAAMIAPGNASTQVTLISQGKLLLEEHPDQVGELPVVAQGLERSSKPSIIQKPAEGYRAYKEMITFGAMRTILQYLEKHALTFETFQNQCDHLMHTDSSVRDAVFPPFVNMGGQIVSERQLARLIEKIKDGTINTWDEIHAMYDQWWELYPKSKVFSALLGLRKLLQADTIDDKQWLMLTDTFMTLCDKNASEIYKSRKKDYDDPFRLCTYRNKEELEAVLGTPEENSFVKESRKAMDILKELAQRFSTWS